MTSVRESLAKMEKDLVAEIGRRRADLLPLERELADVRRARAALPDYVIADGQKRVFMVDMKESAKATEQVEAFSDYMSRKFRLEQDSPYGKLTMKELTIQALRDHFPDGATASKLLEFFSAAWGRNDVIRSSLSPQLSRLKRDGWINRDGLRWFLVHQKDEAPDRDLPEGAP